MELRPNCEYCDGDPQPDSTEARICTYECTFCAGCVEAVLDNVCRNCGGGFAPRPIRPGTELRQGIGLAHQSAFSRRVHPKQSEDEVAAPAAKVKDMAPEDR